MRAAMICFLLVMMFIPGRVTAASMKDVLEQNTIRVRSNSCNRWHPLCPGGSGRRDCTPASCRVIVQDIRIANGLLDAQTEGGVARPAPYGTADREIQSGWYSFISGNTLVTKFRDDRQYDRRVVRIDGRGGCTFSIAQKFYVSGDGNDERPIDCRILGN